MKELVNIFKALSDENRLEIIKMISKNELCVCDICENFDLSQPTVSHHLKLLQQANLVNVTKKGKWNYYSLNTNILKDLITFLNDIVQGNLEISYKLCNSDCDGTRE
ncbi:ArsR/SmtB family transcription factor [Caloranaerobacter ferrireducens]|uniref:ArsR/SmtB family transcription factor n=1 Tax=Caloranaerobacter ferrireducens TaxID=1323370 RepID=UPI000B05F66A|nr:metalloregulator ArsR/SmtB family transcription factor [Caloranaerobacter ferrireducens]